MTLSGIVGNITADATVIRAGETPPVSQLVGLLVNRDTGLISAVHDPRDDKELDNPVLLVSDEPLRMVKVSRAQYEACMSMDAVQALIV